MSLGVKINTGTDGLYGAIAHGSQAIEVPGRRKPWR